MLTVLDNAYFRKAQEHPSYSNTHQKILFLLLHERKYYTKDELLCLANNSLKLLEEVLKDLEEQNLITIEGWLVRLIDPLKLHEVIDSLSENYGKAEKSFSGSYKKIQTS